MVTRGGYIEMDSKSRSSSCLKTTYFFKVRYSTIRGRKCALPILYLYSDRVVFKTSRLNNFVMARCSVQGTASDINPNL